MKMTNIQILTLMLSAAAMAACSKDLTETSKGETPLELTVSQNEIVLDERNYSSTGISLEWTTGTNYGTGNAIDYTLEIAPEQSDYADGLTVDAGRRVYSQSYTVEEFNTLLRDEFGAEAGIAANYKARVTARIAADERIQQSEVTFSATPYEPVTTTLYMIGEASPTGWSVDAPEELKRTKPGYFTWTGNLKAGELKFTTKPGEFIPSYNRDATADNDTTLVYRDSDDDPDEKFMIAEAGGYALTVDLLNLTLTIETADVNTPPFDMIYFVSEANSWSFEPMTQDPVNPFIFRYGAEIGNGQFKFGTAEGSWENMYKAEVDNADYTNTSVVFVSGFDPDNKWLLYADTPNKPYKIALDITPDEESMTMVEFTPYEQIWMIGDATPNGWSLDDATPLQKGSDDYTFTWTGNLNSGELKFTCDCDSSWNGAWFMASEENKPFEAGTETICFVDKQLPENSSVDRKWKVTAGNYTIELNQLTETMTVTKN